MIVIWNLTVNNGCGQRGEDKHLKPQRALSEREGRKGNPKDATEREGRKEERAGASLPFSVQSTA
jgi:hypothetical protein